MKLKPVPPPPVGLAIAFESFLGLAGWRLATWAGVPLRTLLEFSPSSVARGLAALLPMLLVLAWALRSRWQPIADVRNRVGQMSREIFGEASWLDLALASLAAGLGEELLFRGALQPLLAMHSSPLVGLVGVSLLFGLLHAASPAYFVLATLIGAYLGWLAQAFEDLTAPIIAHAVYDFVALAALRRAK
jgi:membrane protease YdiL (CAAX protease family)